MSCETARARLLDASIDEFPSDPHLASCPQCRALAEALVARHADLERALSRQPDLPVSLGLPAPANTPWRWTMSSLALAAAVAATLFVGSQTARRPDPGAGGALPAVQTSPCADLRSLEPAAMTGSLTEDDVACLERLFDGDPRSNANRLLMVHWFSAGDVEAWEERIQLQMDVDRAADTIDPDLAYKLALHVSKRGDDPAEVIRLTDEALAKRGVWVGTTHDSRVVSLHKLRAAAFQQRWQAAVESGADPSVARADTLAAARAWLAFARESGKDETSARQLCEAAAGSPDPCR